MWYITPKVSAPRRTVCALSSIDVLSTKLAFLTRWKCFLGIQHFADVIGPQAEARACVMPRKALARV